MARNNYYIPVSSGEVMTLEEEQVRPKIYYQRESRELVESTVDKRGTNTR